MKQCFTAFYFVQIMSSVQNKDGCKATDLPPSNEAAVQGRTIQKARHLSGLEQAQPALPCRAQASGLSGL